MDRVVVHAPGQVAVVNLPGAHGREVKIDSVIIRANGSLRYEVEWFDDGLRSCFVDHDTLVALSSQVISLCKFNEDH